MRPINKYQIDNKQQFSSVLDAVIDNNLILKAIVGDNPKRSFMKDTMQHSSKFACEYCFASGIPFKNTSNDENSAIVERIKKQRQDIEEQIKNIPEEDISQKESLGDIVKNLNEAEKLCKKKTSSHIVWPANTFNGEPRTKEKVLNIVERIEAGEELSPDERKGVKGRSILLNLDYFDYVNCVPTEYMHLVPLGVVKRLLEVTFSVGENRTRNIKKPLLSPDLFNELMKALKVPHEFPRRIRKLDLSVMKATEFRNVLIFFFPIVTQCLNDSEKEIKVWEVFAFMIRACILPEEEFSAVNDNQIKYCQKTFYTLFQFLYGTRNCTYSVHVLSCHLQNMRSLGPLTETSAFPFEAFYAELRNSFQPGTVSVLKQMMQSVLLKRMLSNHACSETILYKEKDTAMECNSLIYVYESNVHSIYNIKSQEENDMLICNQIGSHPVNFEQTSMLDWSSVGVYKRGGTSSIDVIIPKKNVGGKVLKVGKLLITCPASILREK